MFPGNVDPEHAKVRAAQACAFRDIMDKPTLRLYTLLMTRYLPDKELKRRYLGDTAGCGERL
jgi:hypothetical protein